MKNDAQVAKEQALYAFWEKEGFFHAHPLSDKQPYSLLMPPPNLTGAPHLGHAMQHAILDAIARFKRMQGFDVLLLPGVDHAGIQFEGTLTKLLSKEGLTKQKLGRDAWMKRAWQFKQENYTAYHDTWKFIGISADWSREVFTLDPKVQQAVVTEFSTFWEQDLLYKGAYIVQWCPKCGTAIEDVEMEYEERKEKLYFVRYTVVGEKDASITIATGRPETIFADVAIAVHPGHKQFSGLVGKTVKNPFTQTEIPIIEDKRVEKEFGTGALKITPGHDPLDYAIGKDHRLAILHAVGKDGRLTELAGDMAGLKIAEARVPAVEKLKDQGLLEKVEEYTHAVPVCERCKTTVEPLVSEEWFVRMQPLADKAKKHLSEVNFLPANYHKIINDWLENIHDWSISRSLWWGHRFPVWYCQESNPTHEVGKDKDLVISFAKPTAPCKTCGKTNWVQDEHVLDTWFSSGMWPLATLGWPEKTTEFDKYFPWNFEISAPEIKFLWIARMIMLSLWFTNQVPFTDMFFHGMIRDLQGRKFSKSLGNGIDPNAIREQWGTDALRMALYSYAAPGRDGKASKQTMDERAKNYRNFGTKLRNIYRYIYELKPDDALAALSVSHADDQAISEALTQTIIAVTKQIDAYNFHLATESLYNFVWHELADIYLEQTKKRRAAAQPMLEQVFRSVLILLHPFMPFTTEELYLQLPVHEKSIMLEKWPKA